jgi:hypothetical protein
MIYNKLIIFVIIINDFHLVNVTNGRIMYMIQSRCRKVAIDIRQAYTNIFFH